MNILILGGDGFLGSHVADQMVSLEHKVTVFDRFPYKVSKNLQHQKNNINFVSGEFANRDLLSAALKKQDIVFHFISASTPATSWSDPFIEIDANLKESVQFFELASEAGVRKIVFPSSGGTIYGYQNYLIKEKETMPNPFCPHGIAKLATEFFLQYFKKRMGINYDVYRIGNVYGPRQSITSPQGVIASWMRSILDGEIINVYGNEKTLRDYIYISDVSFLMTHSLKQVLFS